MITQPPQQQAMDTGVDTAEIRSNEDLPSLIIASAEKEEPKSIREHESVLVNDPEKGSNLPEIV